jgi:hypothetical protein
MSEIIFGSSLRGLPNINPEGYGEFRPACGPSATRRAGANSCSRHGNAATGGRSGDPVA